LASAWSASIAGSLLHLFPFMAKDLGLDYQAIGNLLASWHVVGDLRRRQRTICLIAWSSQDLVPAHSFCSRYVRVVGLANSLVA
jgi:hypothetical protein